MNLKVGPELHELQQTGIPPEPVHQQSQGTMVLTFIVKNIFSESSS
jgi:hypothetical protein